MLDKAADIFSADGLQPLLPAAFQVEKKAADSLRVRPQRVGAAVAPIKLSQVRSDRLMAAQASVDNLLQRPADNLLLAS